MESVEFLLKVLGWTLVFFTLGVAVSLAIHWLFDIEVDPDKPINLFSRWPQRRRTWTTSQFR